MVADGFSKTLAFPPLSTTFPERSAKSLGPICDQVTLGVRVMFADREAAIDPPRIAAVADRDVARSGRGGGMAGHDRAGGQCGIAASREGAPGDYKPEPMFACWLTISAPASTPSAARAPTAAQRSGTPACRAGDRARQALPPTARRSPAPSQERAFSGSVQPTTTNSSRFWHLTFTHRPRLPGE